ncbi:MULTISPECIES: SusD/RagB family nutrient-binding outer membrane lipoprotein [Niastella]|uniref:SusD/RagB family nutrient-binding outer membrane lipoprotein n=1 Tax=Niastella soli TaxID=2821487 RepID=A0ABS3Z6R8_9BACT|nr:SusD/RagB family nutrient-binding outer membrane lipoprotein [Niastella soli]MBO9205482.1 SusD/RagB family nutrient-binding outer membrane lipoprotein [Niastella soli]
MKKLHAILFMGLTMLGATSCKKYFDINTNPNSATAASPENILPQALTATAANLNAFNTYGAQLGGYMSNAGGYGGFGVAITYNFTTTNWTGLWSGIYDNLEDYQIIMDKAALDPTYTYYSAVARIMKAVNYQLLVDAYNDVPYGDALRGISKLSPTYTDAKVIYKDLASQLDTAISVINSGSSIIGIKSLSAYDVLFKGDVGLWKQLANTIKLRLILHSSGKVTFANTSFSSDGFLTSDALINPGYVRDNGRQNPKWSTWAFSNTGAAGNKAWMPSTFALTFYDGTKLDDPYRGAASYYQFPKTPTNRLGVENNSIASSPEGSFWYPAVLRGGTTGSDTTGALKGPGAGMPLITAAESYFMQSEAVLKGILTGGNAAKLFTDGITASFTYLYTKPDGKIVGTPVNDANAYIAANATNATKAYLTDISLTADPKEKLEAIITQKYIALNMVNSEEAWNEYRRTHYPVLVNTAGADGEETFASSVSESTRPDHLPTRILYPASEGAYNSSNVPKNIGVFSSLIFWAL